MAKVIIDVVDVEYMKETLKNYKVEIVRVVNQPGCWEATLEGEFEELEKYMSLEYCLGMDDADADYYMSFIEA